MNAEEPGSEDQPLSPQFVHVLRTSQIIHMQLSQMADQKASILMGATFLIFTISIGQVSSGYGPTVSTPFVILGVAAFLCAVLAIFAVMPATPRANKSGRINLLFFGSFTQLDEEEYVVRLRQAVSADPDAFETMARDLYEHGQLLKRRKYRLLGWAYRVFLVGLSASFVTFLWQVLQRLNAAQTGYW